MKIAVLLCGRTQGDAKAPSLGPCEDAALRLACLLARARPRTTLFAISAAEKTCEPALLRAATLGARPIRVWHPALVGADYDAFARTLAATARHLDIALVFAGDRSIDGGMGAIGPATAEHLGFAHVTGIVDAEWNGSKELRVARQDGVVRRMTGPLPLLLTTAERVLPYKNPRKSRSMHAIEDLPLTTVGVLPEELHPRRQFEGNLADAVRPRAELLGGVSELVGRLRQSGWL